MLPDYCQIKYSPITLSRNKIKSYLKLIVDKYIAAEFQPPSAKIVLSADGGILPVAVMLRVAASSTISYNSLILFI